MRGSQNLVILGVFVGTIHMPGFSRLPWSKVGILRNTMGSFGGLGSIVENEYVSATIQMDATTTTRHHDSSL